MRVRVVLLALAAAAAVVASDSFAVLRSDESSTGDRLMSASSSGDQSRYRSREAPSARADRTLRPRRPPDPDLEPGFPVQTYETAGSYHGGPAIHALVGNLDPSEPTLEILVSALANGPLYAWNSDGSLQSGWPRQAFGAAYPAVGWLSPWFAPGQVFAGHFGTHTRLVVFEGSTGGFMPGWPRDAADFVATPASLADVNGEGIDEIFVEENDGYLHAYTGSGSVLPGWPARCDMSAPDLHTPAIGDLDGNGQLEIVSATGVTAAGVYLCAFHRDGTSVAGFPITVSGPSGGIPDTFAAIGDVDGDGAEEIVVVTRYEPGDQRTKVKVFSGSGTLEQTLIATGGIAYGTAPALGDLDGDGTPEIVVQTDSALNVWKGDGTTFPGWPRTWPGQRWLGNSAPVIGDVDGDGFQDIAITTQVAGSPTDGEVRLFDRNGEGHPRFPKELLIGAGGVPAIADIDRDGRNELVVVGSAWFGQDGLRDRVWAYDLHGSSYGGIEWGQFGGDARHRNHYVALPAPPPPHPPPPPPPPRHLHLRHLRPRLHLHLHLHLRLQLQLPCPHHHRHLRRLYLHHLRRHRRHRLAQRRVSYRKWLD